MNYFDAHTWIGRWPFAFCDVHSPATLSMHVKKHGIRQALVSPLDAVFAPEPGPANADLLRETRGLMALHPVPVINPALGNWREELANAAGDPRVRAVRLLPNYHNYRLKLRAVDELMQAALERGLRVIIQARLIDERHEYHAMMIKGVPVKELDMFLQLHAKTPVLVSGLLQSELRPLATKHPQLYVDLSWAEWHDSITYLLDQVPVRQLVFASHTPFLIAAAARAKLDTAAVSPAKLRAIAGENLRRFLRE